MRTEQLTRDQLEAKAASYDPPIDVSACRTKDEVHQTIVRELAARNHGVDVPLPGATGPSSAEPGPRTLWEALGAVLRELGPIAKNGKAPANMGGYDFRRVEDITAALKPLFAKHGLFVIPTVLERVDSQRATGRGGVLYCTNLRIAFRFVFRDGAELTSEVWGEGTDSGDKCVQKAVTSAFKTMVSVVFCISDSELDAEAHDVPPSTGEAPPPAPAADETPVERVQTIRTRLADVVSAVGYPDAWKSQGLPSAKLLDQILAGEFYLPLEQANACEVVLTEAERYIAAEDPFEPETEGAT